MFTGKRTKSGYYPLEWECEAFEEVKYLWFSLFWNFHLDSLARFNEINGKMWAFLTAHEVKLRKLKFESDQPDIDKLLHKIVKELIVIDPILQGIYVHNKTYPGDVDIRHTLRNQFIPHQEIRSCIEDLISFDILNGSALAQELSVSGIPLSTCFVGQVLQWLFDSYRHYELIDQVKDSGVAESITDLRRNRIYESPEGTVHDYTPFFREIISPNKRILEIYNEDHFKALNISTSRTVDDELCFAMQKSAGDKRQDVIFGESDTVKNQYIIRCGKQEKAIPLQLLPKWYRKIKKEAFSFQKKQPLELTAGIRKQEDGKDDRETRIEVQEALFGLQSGALSWKGKSGPATHWLSEKIVWALKEAYADLATEAYRKKREDVEKEEAEKEDRLPNFSKKILREQLESNDGSLNEVPEGESIQRIEMMPAEEHLTFESQVILSEIRQKYPEIKSLLEKQEQEEPLTPAERQLYHRIVYRYRNSK